MPKYVHKDFRSGPVTGKMPDTKGKLHELHEPVPMAEIEAPDIMEADKIFRDLTGIDPTKSLHIICVVR